MAQNLWRIHPSTLAQTVAGPDFRGKLTRVVWRYDPPCEFEFQCSVDDEALADLDPSTTHEVLLRLKRGPEASSEVVMVGRPVTRRADSKSRTFTITVKDPMWYFTRRYVGRPHRNYLTNGDFENDTDGWTNNNLATFTTQPTVAATRAESARLQSGSGPNSNNAYISQGLAVTTGRLGLLMIGTGWLYISSFGQPPAFNLGMLLRRVNATGAGSQAAQSMTAETPRGSWQRYSVSVQLPPNVTEIVEMRLYAPDGGVVFWDAVTLTVMESLYFSPTDDTGEMGYAMKTILQFAQGRGQYQVLGRFKSDLQINLDFEDTGEEIERAFQLADYQKVYDGGSGNGAIDEYMKGDGRVDLEWDYETRTIHGRYPQKGRLITELWSYRFSNTVRGDNSNFVIVGYEYGDSVEQTANDITILGGWGSGGSDPSREIGNYENADSLNGVTLEEVDTAPQGAPLRQLDRIARGRGKQVEDPIDTLKIHVKEERDPITDEVTYPIINAVFPGDRVDVEIVDGSINIFERFRIVEMELDPDTEVISVTLNPVAPGDG